MTQNLQAKREKEKQIVSFMIHLYCYKKHHTEKGCLCPDCQTLETYALERTERCPRMAEKTFCSSCPVPCYKPELRERLRAVMKFAGPRMLVYYPTAALKHFFEEERIK